MVENVKENLIGFIIVECFFSLFSENFLAEKKKII